MQRVLEKYLIVTLSFLFVGQLYAINYADSLEQHLNKLSADNYIIELLETPYDKLVANTTKFEQLLKNGLSKAKQINNPEKEADIYNKLALINAFLGNNDKRLSYNLQAIKTYEQQGNKTKAGITYAELAYSMKIRNIEQAKLYMQKGIRLLEQENDKKALNPAYDNYGVILEFDGKIDSAIYYYNRALELKIEQEDSIGIPFALGHLSGAYLIKKDFKKAKKYLDEAYSIRLKRNDVYGIAETKVLYADFYFSQNNFKEAIIWFTDCYESAITNNYVYLAQYAAEHAALCYMQLNDFKQALFYQKEQQNLKDSILNEKTNSTIAELEIQFETQKKEKQIAIHNATIASKQLQIKQRSYLIYILIGIAVLIIVIGYFILKQVRFKQQKLIEENRLKDDIAKMKLKVKLNEERLRISRDLHDNIGSQLTFIISSIDNMNFLIKETNTELKNRLNELNEYSRNAIAQLRQTINSLNKK